MRSCMHDWRLDRERELGGRDGKAPRIPALSDAHARGSMSKKKLATVWLDGCSGCHMSFLDMDERLIELAGKIELVYSPLVDVKEFPKDVDVTIVEGAVATNEDEAKIKKIRRRTKFLLALGDCGITGNVPAMRNGY